MSDFYIQFANAPVIEACGGRYKIIPASDTGYVIAKHQGAHAGDWGKVADVMPHRGDWVHPVIIRCGDQCGCYKCLGALGALFADWYKQEKVA